MNEMGIEHGGVYTNSVANQTELPMAYRCQMFMDLSSTIRETLFEFCLTYIPGFAHEFADGGPLSVDLPQYWTWLPGKQVPTSAVDESVLEDKGGSWNKAEGHCRGTAQLRNAAFHFRERCPLITTIYMLKDGELYMRFLKALEAAKKFHRLRKVLEQFLDPILANAKQQRDLEWATIYATDHEQKLIEERQDQNMRYWPDKECQAWRRLNRQKST